MSEPTENKPAHVHTVTPAGLIPAPDVALPTPERAKTFTLESPAEAEAHAAFPPLLGEWRANNGYLCNGTLRVARSDFDTDPSPKFRREVFEWIAKTLNEAAALRGERDEAVKLSHEAYVAAKNKGKEMPAGMKAKSDELVKFANSNPALLSLLYDLNLLPEQLQPGSWRWGDMLNVIAHFQSAITRAETAEGERDAAKPWVLFYRDGKTLGEVAEICGGTIYDYSPWILAPINKAIYELAAERDAAITRAEKAEGELEKKFLGVLSIRCTKHLNIPQQNKAEFSGGECGGCIADERDHALRQVETLRAAMKKAIDRPGFLYADGSKFITDALASPAAESQPEKKGGAEAQYVSAVSGLFYDNPKAAGDISAIIVDGHCFQLAEPAAPANEDDDTQDKEPPHEDTIFLEWVFAEIADNDSTAEIQAKILEIERHWFDQMATGQGDDFRSAIRAAMSKEGR